MKNKELGSAVLLFLAACIWGVAFVAQSVGMDYVGPFTFNGCRFLIGGLVLTPFALVREKKYEMSNGYQSLTVKEQKKHKKTTLVGGLYCGVAICVASSFQQAGMLYTSVGKAGFITALYIVLVPVMGIFLKKKVAPIVWFGVVLAAIGFYFLCITESFSINYGDMLLFVCAICFTFHILIIDYFAPKADGVALSCIQFWFSGIVCMGIAILKEAPDFVAIFQAAIPILYAGVMSCGVAYTLQIIGQKHMKPTVASLILSLESVISVLAGWVILHEVLTGRQLLGCILVFGAVILAQLPVKSE